MGEMFELLEEGLKEAIAYEKGKKKLRTSYVSIPKPSKTYTANDFKRLRKKLNCSQGVLASILNVSVKTVQSWELGARIPNHAAQRLIEIIDKGPEFLEKLLPKKTVPRRGRSTRTRMAANRARGSRV